MSQLNNGNQKKSIPNGKPVKPKKPVPTKEEPVKVPVPCSVLTEERVREIAREEVQSIFSQKECQRILINLQTQGGC